MNCPPDKAFWLEDGRSLTNINELRAALKTMPPAMYKHHVQGSRNDFASWVEHVFGKKQLARAMRKIRTKNDLIKVLSPAKHPKTERTMARTNTKKKTATKKQTKKTARKKPQTTKKEPILDEKFTISPEQAHPHIAMVTHIALGVVIGSAITILILTL